MKTDDVDARAILTQLNSEHRDRMNRLIEAFAKAFPEEVGPLEAFAIFGVALRAMNLAGMFREPTARKMLTELWERALQGEVM